MAAPSSEYPYPGLELFPADNVFPSPSPDIYQNKARIRYGAQRVVHRAASIARETKPATLRLVRR